MQLLVDALAEVGLAVVVVHDVEPFVDGLHVFQGEHEPSPEQTASHGAHRPVDDIEQRLAVVLHGVDQFEAADGELIQSYILILLDARDRCDMAYLGVLGLFEILQNGSSSDDT